MEKTVVVNARVEVVQVAQWVEWMERRGIAAKSMSFVIGLAMGALVRELEKRGEVREMTAEEGWEELKKRGLVQKGMLRTRAARLLEAGVVDLEMGMGRRIGERRIELDDEMEVRVKREIEGNLRLLQSRGIDARVVRKELLSKMSVEELRELDEDLREGKAMATTVFTQLVPYDESEEWQRCVRGFFALLERALRVEMQSRELEERGMVVE